MDAGGEGGADAGAGGGPSITPDALDNANFEAVVPWPPAGTIPSWTVTPATSAAFIKWHAANDGVTPGGPIGHRLEHWAAAAYTVTTAQVVNPLPAGEYTFKVHVRAAPAMFTSQYVFARGYSATDANALLKTDITTSNVNGSTYSVISVGPIPVTSGQCEVGVFSDGTAGAWASFDEATLAKN
jgi:hypothetical protein